MASVSAQPIPLSFTGAPGLEDDVPKYVAMVGRVSMCSTLQQPAALPLQRIVAEASVCDWIGKLCSMLVSLLQIQA
jgi:hypothetical protein